jgi:hypothetical protein
MVVAKGWYDSYVLCSSIAPSAFWENQKHAQSSFPCLSIIYGLVALKSL